MNVFVHPELRTPTSDRSVVADGVNGAVYVFLLSSSLRNHKFPVVSQVGRNNLLFRPAQNQADLKIVFVLFDRCR